MNTAIGNYYILDTLYPSKTVSTDRPLVTYAAAHQWAAMRNIACGMPFRYAVKRNETGHGIATLALGSL